ncbi:hypothetical protein [Bacillus andreraoultii]|uniref:hypothetical protein n=1 Tax=Bacillus andreraoultii TaxID=1499685 RepID=UPI00053A2D21|nr:hypothetical protein [Bacillus andreraoultii]
MLDYYRQQQFPGHMHGQGQFQSPGHTGQFQSPGHAGQYFPGFPGAGQSNRIDRLEREVNRLEREVNRLDNRLRRVERRLGM